MPAIVLWDLATSPQRLRVAGTDRVVHGLRRLYVAKGATNPERIGDGNTKAAARRFLESGETTFGRDHLIKGRELVSGLGKWLQSNPGADPEIALRVVCKRMLLDGRPLPSDTST